MLLTLWLWLHCIICRSFLKSAEGILKQPISGRNIDSSWKAYYVLYSDSPLHYNINFSVEMKHSKCQYFIRNVKRVVSGWLASSQLLVLLPVTYKCWVLITQLNVSTLQSTEQPAWCLGGPGLWWGGIIREECHQPGLTCHTARGRGVHTALCTWCALSVQLYQCQVTIQPNINIPPPPT